MAPVRTVRRRVLRLSVGAGLACGLLAAPAAPGAGAAPARFEPPTILGLTLDPPNALVTFRDNVGPGSGGTDIGVIVTLQEKDHPAVVLRSKGPGVPGGGRVSTRTVSGVKPDTTYCAVAQSQVRRDVEDVTDVNDAALGLLNGFTSNSGKVCAGGRPGTGTESGTSSVPDESGVVISDEGALTTDVALRSVTGDATGPVNGTRNYWMEYTNEGRTPAKDIVVEVQTSGALAIRRPPDSGTFNGFTCSATGASGGATGGFRCTGGTLGPGESGRIPVLTKITKVGTGTVHASVNTPNDPSRGNNATTFTMTGQ
ncbi:hypothetical protein [Streptomyces lavendulae]|uniref:hypothetical protein n=1 Tax=Streptomyces lavendulae TaxID=1914 RepID=UPI0036C419A3